MNRSDYFNLIEQKLHFLAYRIEGRGRLNILDLNLHSENFYLHFLNLLFGWELRNLNTIQQNAPGIDLVDDTNKIVAQVTATTTKQKVESALRKLSVYQGYSFKFISISKNAKELRAKTFNSPHGLTFSPDEDIYDVPSLLRIIQALDIDQMQKVYEFLKKELKSEPDSVKIESNLTTIINILSKEDWKQKELGIETIPFDIEAKISFNQLDAAKSLIEDYKIHYFRIEKIYSDFDKQGANKSLSILNGIRTEYLTLGPADSPDQIFFSIITNVIQKIQKSSNYIPMPEEELQLCVSILVVDAFIRCKIFKHPARDDTGGADAHS
jgi:hypothetical protein